MPMFVAPIAGLLSRPHRLAAADGAGLALQAVAMAWLAIVSTPTSPTASSSCRFVHGRRRHGARLRARPRTRCSLGAPEEAGQASGATNTIREIGGVLGVAVLSTVFSSAGCYAPPQAYMDGMTAALPVGAAVLAVGRARRAARPRLAARARAAQAPPVSARGAGAAHVRRS